MFLALAVPNHVGKIFLIKLSSHWPLQITLGRSSQCGFPRTGRSKSREEDLPNAVFLALAAPNHVRKLFLMWFFLALAAPNHVRKISRMWFSSHWPPPITLGRYSQCGFPPTGGSQSREEDLPNVVFLALAAPNRVRKIFLMWFSSHWPLQIT